MKAMICTPMSGGMAYGEYFFSILSEAFNHPDRLQNLAKYDLSWNKLEGYSGLGKDRSVMASAALRHNIDKIVFIDSDQLWKWNELKALLDSEKKIISAVIPVKKYPLQLNFTPCVEDIDLFDSETHSEMIVTGKDLPKLKEKYGTSEIKVQLVGTGMLCIDRSVLEKMTEKCEPFSYPDSKTNKNEQCWEFFPTGVVNGRWYGEDAGFSIMAQRCGFDPYVNVDIKIPHIGKHVYVIGNSLVKDEDLPKRLNIVEI